MNTHSLRRSCAIRPVAAGALAALLVFGAGAGCAAGDSGRWVAGTDARLGVTVVHPAGWTVQTQGYAVIVRSADRSALVLAEAFAGRPGETAEAHVQALPAAHAALFPQARVEKVAPREAAGQDTDEVVGALSYRGTGGRSGEARVLCSVFHGSGMLYAVAAPSARFAAERPTLLRVLKSLRFGSPPRNAAAGGKGGPAAVTTSDAPRFVKWTDPKEHAFTAEVPAGWRVDGGAFRVAPTDVRQMVRVSSPGGDIVVQIGDPGLSRFNLPTPLNQQIYHVSEGVPFPMGTFQNTLLHYMPAPDFNLWYLDRTLAPNVDGLTVGETKDLPDVARREKDATAAAAARFGVMSQTEVTAAQTEFTGREKGTGKPISGVLTSLVSLTPAPDPSRVSWTAKPFALVVADDARTAARKKLALEVLGRVNHSLQPDPAWLQRFRQEIAAGNQQVTAMTDAMNQQSLAFSRINAQGAEANEQSIMGSYWNKVGQDDEMQRHQANYYGDKTDVRDPETGEAFKVDSGYSNYYHDPRTGVILGTNSAYRPPVDFTPLTEF